MRTPERSQTLTYTRLRGDSPPPEVFRLPVLDSPLLYCDWKLRFPICTPRNSHGNPLKNPEITRPRSHSVGIPARHHPRDLRNVREIVNDPRREQLAHRN